MDALKDFIAQNRHAFDAAVPDAHGWRGLSKALERLKTADGEASYILRNRVLLDTAAAPDHVWQKIAAVLDAQHDCMENGSGDPLEDFIRCHRADFDAAVPDAAAWSNIVRQLEPEQRNDIGVPLTMPLRVSWQRSLLRVAASVGLLVVGMGIGMWYMRAGGGLSDEAVALSDVSSEYAEMEQFYQRDIAAKRQKVAQFAGQQEPVISQDLQQLDHSMAELRYELEQAPPGNREQIVRAMIENYKTKVSILERVLEHIEPEQKPAQKTEDL